ncbi:NAD-dependent epimerase/dehydratase family protein [Paraflavitalea sp. CAU 1676]|uniref:NAD-dependent epimerase/dehydratase family protein n=1 Tax=Paraflavitalea sp. CAU 1676 TaxID=3032598 RepID=UPI0023DBCB13|nr:NAD-dependent epimerase/dehydratase family protein [Paraflavitalea sp. CAU 1676]MDF2188767.1 NAD-dependent epimerase/dehydratase family protein [Paraflavitalea sp. CAU 1676]
MKKNVLVTGATGFIGPYVVNILLQLGFNVTATSTHAQKAASAPWFRSVNYIPLNLEQIDDSTNYFTYLNSPDILIHLAWEGLPNYKADFHLTQNLPRHQQFLKNLISNGLKDLTVVGTCFEYGMHNGQLEESLNPEPTNAYAKAKNELRIFLANLQKTNNLSFKWARLFYMYGAGQHPNSLLSQLETALQNGDEKFNMSGGEQLRDYLPVEQVAYILVRIASQQKVEGIINVASGSPVSVKQLVELYLKRTGQQIELNLGYYPYPDFEPMRFWGDITKLKTILHDEQSNSGI